MLFMSVINGRLFFAASAALPGTKYADHHHVSEVKTVWAFSNKF